ncbi:MAG: serine/threonine-protein kinase [candidate division Zixibacteria bacterium]|nr:serine/threonine-protein kinase [candidate division Zixibacteria bacterium]
MDQNILESLDRFEVLKKIGEGDNGQVFKVKELETGRFAVLKIINEQLSKMQEFKGSAITNIKAIANIDNPVICTVSEILKIEGNFIIISEFVEGIPITEFFKLREFNYDLLITIIEKIVEGLKSIHKEKLHHGNIKPSNILITKDGHVSILDYGYPNKFDLESIHYDNCADDDFQYLSPEIINGEASSRSSDLYSLGVIIYESIFASLPFKANDNKELMKKITYDSIEFDFNKVPNIPGDMVLMVKKLLAKSPADRFMDASTFQITVEAMEKFSKKKIKPEEPQNTRSITTSAFLAISLIFAVLMVFWVVIGRLLK